MSELPPSFPLARPRRFNPYSDYRDSGIEWLGKIPRHWDVTCVKRLFRVENGSTPKSEDPTYWDGDIAWVTPDDLGRLDESVIHATARRITQEGYESCGTRLVPAGSMILSTRAPIGHLAIAGVPVCTNQGCRALVFRDDDNRRFMYFTLLAATPALEALGRGSTFKELAADDLGDFKLCVPSTIEQGTIAEFLDRETAKIAALLAKKERLIELLHERRAALITRAVTKGLDPTVPMKDPDLEWFGTIPAHWTVLHLRRAISRFVDYRGQTPEKTLSGVPLVTARNIKHQRIDFSTSEEFIAEDFYERWMVRGLPEPGDVLITTEAPLGESAQIDDANIALAQRLILLKANKMKVANDYLKYHFAADSGRAELWSKATGSTALGIKASHLKATLIPVPPIAEQSEIARHLDLETAKIDALLGRVLEAIDQLKELRIVLISAAVTGKIDVREETA